MLVNPLLQKMSEADKNQRYKNTYVLYDGEVCYVAGFMDEYITLLGKDKKKKTVVFDYLLLDTSRPPSKWYVLVEKDGSTNYRNAVYLTYPPKKQYHRGLHEDNINLGYVDRELVGFDLFTTLLTQKDLRPNVERIHLLGRGVFKDHLLYVGPDIYFRNNLIASLDYVQKVIYYEDIRFRQEVEEAIIGIDAFKVEKKKKFVAKAYKYKELQDDFWREVARDIVPPVPEERDHVFLDGAAYDAVLAEIKEELMLLRNRAEPFNINDLVGAR